MKGEPQRLRTARERLARCREMLAAVEESGSDDPIVRKAQASSIRVIMSDLEACLRE